MLALLGVNNLNSYFNRSNKSLLCFLKYILILSDTLKKKKFGSFCSSIYTFVACHRYKDKLPSVDIFVGTADPKIEPPILVINTILSTMSYNYPLDMLSIYLSDDGGSELTYYVLLEASSFSKHWIPFCKKINVVPRSPGAFFAQQIDVQDIIYICPRMVGFEGKFIICLLRSSSGTT